MSIAKTARPDRLSWRLDKRGRLRPTWGYELPPLVSCQYEMPDRVTTDVPSQRLMPPLNISLPRISFQSVSAAYLDAALFARGIG